MHLTNYAINKNSKKYVENNINDSDDGEDYLNNTDCGQDEPHKRSLKQLYATLQAKGHNIDKIKRGI